MNTKLELVRLSNDDVISTSGVCGVGQLGKKSTEVYKFYWNLNNTNMSSVQENLGSDNDYQGYTDEDAWYHCDANGNIIEKCTHGTTAVQIYAAHGIKWNNNNYL